MTDSVSLRARPARLADRASAAHADEQALDVLATVLGQLDKENRLFRALMYDRQLAAGVSAFHPASSLSGIFAVVLNARPGQELDELVTIADAEIERLKAEGPTADEVLKAQNTQESQLVVGLQSAGRKADFLNNYNVEFGDPLAYKAEMVKLFAVTPDDVKRVANKYLTANRVRLDVNPGPQTPRPAEVEVDRDSQAPLASPTVAEVKDDFRPLGDAEGRPEPRVHPAAGRAPEAVERAGGAGRRAARAADPDPQPGRQGGRDARPRRQGRARLDDRRAC